MKAQDEYPRLERAVLVELARQIKWLAAAQELRGAVITGSERAFAAGAEIPELTQLNASAAFEFARYGQSVMTLVSRSTKPIVAAIRGYCLGGGLDLALACHARIAMPDAVFAHPGGALGILTGWGGTQRLPRLIGRSRAMELFVTGRKISAEEAYAWGLVTGICAPGDLLASAIRAARHPMDKD